MRRAAGFRLRAAACSAAATPTTRRGSCVRPQAGVLELRASAFHVTRKPACSKCVRRHFMSHATPGCDGVRTAACPARQKREARVPPSTRRGLTRTPFSRFSLGAASRVYAYAASLATVPRRRRHFPEIEITFDARTEDEEDVQEGDVINLCVKVERKHLPEEMAWADSDDEDDEPDEAIFEEQVARFGIDRAPMRAPDEGPRLEPPMRCPNESA